MKNITTILTVVVSVVAVVLLTTKFDYDNTKAFEYIITFLSIAAGFSITALSIIANSSFSGNLYNIEDEDDNSKTLLHVLVAKFRHSISVFIITIALILFYYFINGDGKDVHAVYFIRDFSITVPKILKSTIWVLTVISSLKFSSLIVTFSKFVIKSVPKN